VFVFKKIVLEHVAGANINSECNQALQVVNHRVID